MKLDVGFFDFLKENMLKIEKVINNNIVTSTDEQGREIIVMGRGLGFGKKQGEEVLTEKIEKIFSISDKVHYDYFKTILEKIPLEHIQTTNEIIAYAKETLNKELSENIYIVLTDHINFAIERQKKGIKFQNALLWEIKKIYHQEYLIGVEAVKIIEKNLDVILTEHEAGFIALHIVNAELDTDMHQSMTMTKVIQGILNIVKYFYKIDLDENSINYERFITHLKFFIQRVYSKHCYESEDTIFIQTITKQYPKAYECAGRIREFIIQKLEYELEEEEMIYLTVHIQRITR